MALHARVLELEARLAKDSHTSSKPPSSDGFPRKPRSLRRSSGRKPGGQPGHEGTTLRQVAEPNEQVIYPLPEVRDARGARFCAEAAQLTKEPRQVFDLQPIRFQMTGRRVLEVRWVWQTPRESLPHAVPFDYGMEPQGAAESFTRQRGFRGARPSSMLCRRPATPPRSGRRGLGLRSPPPRPTPLNTTPIPSFGKARSNSIPTMPKEQLCSLMQRFGEMLLAHHIFAEVFATV